MIEEKISNKEKILKCFEGVGLKSSYGQISDTDFSIGINVKVKPGSKIEKVKINQEKLEVSIQNRAIEGAANKGILKSVAKIFGISPTSVLIHRGARSKDKHLILNYVLSENKGINYFCKKVLEITK